MRNLPGLLLIATCAVAQQSYDLVVYGGTAGGVMTAVSGARQGLKTVLLEPGNHVGGMATGGLSRTDVGKRDEERPMQTAAPGRLHASFRFMNIDQGLGAAGGGVGTSSTEMILDSAPNCL